MHEIEPSTSPFEAIRHEDHLGEFWTGRALMLASGYGADWRNFVDVIGRAKAACINAKHDPDRHIVAATKMVPIGSGAHRAIADYRLSRFGAYLVAMNGDPHKEEIAEAQTYFTIRTRQAELADEPMDELELAERNVQLIKEKRALLARAMEAEQTLAIAGPKADAWDVLASAEGDYSVRQAAYILNRDPAIRTGQNRLFKLLREWKMIDRNDVPYYNHNRHVVLRPREFFNPFTDKKELEDQVRVTVNGLSYIHKKMGGTMRFSKLLESVPEPEISIALPPAPAPMPEPGQKALFELGEEES